MTANEIRRQRRPSMPGAILKAHYLDPRGISVTELAEAIDLSRKHASQIVNGHKRIEPPVAAKLAKVLGTTTHFWLNLQAAVDAWDAEANVGRLLESIDEVPPLSAEERARLNAITEEDIQRHITEDGSIDMGGVDQCVVRKSPIW